jgi:hypothetical protein
MPAHCVFTTEDKKMNCIELKHKLPDYIDQLLDKQEVKPVKDHLRTCRSCQREYRLYDMAVTSVANLPLLYPSPEFNSKVFSALGLEYKPVFFPAWSKWAAGLASLALMWAGGAMLAVIYAVSKLGLAQTYLYLKNPQKVLTALQFALIKTWFVLSDAVNNAQALTAWLFKGSTLPLQISLSFLAAAAVVMLAMVKMRYQPQGRFWNHS